MRNLTAIQLTDIARGAAVLGTGGGGDPYLGSLAAKQAFEKYGPPRVIQVEELADDAQVASPVMIGAPVPFIEKFALGAELTSAYTSLAGVLNRRLDALLPYEIGGVNTMVALALGMSADLPVIDADMMGRAYPELQLVTPTLFGIKATPFALADEHGNQVILYTVDNRWAERVGRSVAIEFGAVCAGMGFPMLGRQVREAAISSSLSYAERIGRTLREARELGRDTIASLVEVTTGYVLFKGKIADVNRRTHRGWSTGESVIDGLEEFVGSQMTVKFQNENLVAMVGDVPVATVPDLITILDAETGQAITTERLRYGFRVVVFGLPCDSKWRTQAGIALGGPRHFGYDMDYVTLEELVATAPRAMSSAQPEFGYSSGA